jgi:hypothetical protein
MSRLAGIDHEFVELIPADPVEGIIYISIPYATATHRCVCGCGEKVVTPLSPTDWRLTFDGVSVSLHPSVGNWSFPCQSHYFIRRNRIDWARPMSREKIEAGRARDARAKQRYFEHGEVPRKRDKKIQTALGTEGGKAETRGLWSRVWHWLSQQ